MTGLRSTGEIVRDRLAVLPSLWIVPAFVVLAATALVADSPILAHLTVAGRAFDGRAFDAVVVPVFLAGLFVRLRPDQRLLVALVIPVTAIGEVLLSLVLRLYTYRIDAIPFYVPFGHAVIVASTLILADAPALRRSESVVRRALLSAYAVLGVVALVVGDSLSLLLGAVFVYVMWRSKGRLFYVLMASTVLFVEAVGAFVGTWRWSPTPFGLLHTTNPPLAVYTIYVLGDAGLLRLTALVRAMEPVLVDPFRRIRPRALDRRNPVPAPDAFVMEPAGLPGEQTGSRTSYHRRPWRSPDRSRS